MRPAICWSMLLSMVHSSFAAITVDFEDWQGGSADQTSIVSRGFNLFTTNGTFFISPDAAHGNPTLSLHTNSGILLMTRVGGGQFNVESVRLQEGFSAPDAIGVTVTGLRDFGVVAKEILILDGLADTYDSFLLPPFANVDRLLFEPYGGSGGAAPFSIDDIVIPEPTSAFLMLIAFCLFFLSRQ